VADLVDLHGWTLSITVDRSGERSDTSGTIFRNRLGVESLNIPRRHTPRSDEAKEEVLARPIGGNVSDKRLPHRALGCRLKEPQKLLALLVIEGSKEALYARESCVISSFSGLGKKLFSILI
jgi:hypothetical protein